MKDTPLISIIIPVYNVEHYLDKCLESVCGQTYTNLEIILVDDGSTDKSGEICDAYAAKDARIKVIHQENVGQSAARNVALEVAQGDFLGFVDSDDWIEPDMYRFLYLSWMNIIQIYQYVRITEIKMERVLQSLIPERLLYMIGMKLSVN